MKAREDSVKVGEVTAGLDLMLGLTGETYLDSMGYQRNRALSDEKESMRGARISIKQLL